MVSQSNQIGGSRQQASRATFCDNFLVTLQDAAQQVAEAAQHSGQGRGRITFASRQDFCQVEGLGGPLLGAGQGQAVLLLGQDEGDLLSVLP